MIIGRDGACSRGLDPDGASWLRRMTVREPLQVAERDVGIDAKSMGLMPVLD
jgi:hypothetical protein